MRLILVLCLGLSFYARSQEILHKGRVTDQSMGESLSDVSVFLENSPAKGAKTNSKGIFSLTTHGEATALVFSRVRYERKKITIEGQTYFELALSDGSNQFDEVMVNLDKKDLRPNFYACVNATWQQLRDINKYIPGTESVANPTYKLLIPKIQIVFGN